MMKTTGETGEAWTLDAGMEYDAYRWMLGDSLLIGSGRTVEVLAELIPEGESAEVCLYATYRGYEFKETVSLNRPSSVGQVALTAIRVPSVISQALDVELPADCQARVEVYGLNGQSVASVATHGGNVQLDAATWVHGVYLVKITTASATVARKVVKR